MLDLASESTAALHGKSQEGTLSCVTVKSFTELVIDKVSVSLQLLCEAGAMIICTLTCSL